MGNPKITPRCPDGCFNRPERWTTHTTKRGELVFCKQCNRYIGRAFQSVNRTLEPNKKNEATR